MSGCERGMIWAEALTQADDCTLQANNCLLYTSDAADD